MNKVEYEVAGISDVGIAKKVNEDSLVYKVADMGSNFAGIFAIADGVGNLQKGELASSMAVTKIIEWWENEFMNRSGDFAYLKNTLYSTIEDANNQLVNLQITDNLKTASTLSVMFLYGDNCTIYNVGDSRIYKYTHNIFKPKMQQLTEDHSCEIEKNVNGSIIRKNVLTEYIGKKSNLSILRKECRAKPGEIYIVCSDGIYKTMTTDGIRQIVGRNKDDMVSVCRELVKKVKNNKETDNISVIAVKLKK